MADAAGRGFIRADAGGAGPALLTSSASSNSFTVACATLSTMNSPGQREALAEREVLLKWLRISPFPMRFRSPSSASGARRDDRIGLFM